MPSVKNPNFKYTRAQKLNTLRQKKSTLNRIFDKPELLFDELEFPVVSVEGVEKIDGKFYYKGEQYSSVELVAKKFYEEQGFSASYSEGGALFLSFICVMSFICTRLKSKLRIAEPVIYKNGKIFNRKNGVPYDDIPPEVVCKKNLKWTNNFKNKNNLELAFEKGGYLFYKEIAMDLDYYIGVTASKNIYIINDVSRKTVRKYIFDFAKDLDCNFSSYIEELKKYIHDFYDINNLSKGFGRSIYFNNLKFNNESFEFAIEIIKAIGAVNILKSYKKEGSFNVTFDLTVIDSKNKKIRCVEVKNSDNFTQSQISSMHRFVSSIFLQAELCLVRPKIINNFNKK